jgi:hypothetical protein
VRVGDDSQRGRRALPSAGAARRAVKKPGG